MKAKAKSSKPKDPTNLKLNFDKIPYRPHHKSTDLHHSPDFYSSKNFNDLHSDYDDQKFMTSSSARFSNPHRKTMESSSLLQFSIKLQNASESMKQYFNSLKSDAVANITYEDLGHLIHSPAIPGLQKTFSESESFRRILTTGASDTGNSPIIGSENRYEEAGSRKTMRSFTSHTPRSPQDLAIFQAQMLKFSDSYMKSPFPKPKEIRHSDGSTAAVKKPTIKPNDKKNKTFRGPAAKRLFSTSETSQTSRIFGLNLERLNGITTPTDDENLRTLDTKENRYMNSPPMSKDRGETFAHKSRSFKRDTPSFLKDDYSKLHEKLSKMSIRFPNPMLNPTESILKGSLLEEIDAPILETKRDTALSSHQMSRMSPKHSIVIDNHIAEPKEEKKEDLRSPKEALKSVEHGQEVRKESGFQITITQITQPAISIKLVDDDEEDWEEESQQRIQCNKVPLAPSNKLSLYSVEQKSFNSESPRSSARLSFNRSIQADKSPTSMSQSNASLTRNKPGKLNTDASPSRSIREPRASSPDIGALSPPKQSSDDKTRKSFTAMPTQSIKRKSFRSKALMVKLGGSFISSLRKNSAKQAVARKDQKSASNEPVATDSDQKSKMIQRRNSNVSPELKTLISPEKVKEESASTSTNINTNANMNTNANTNKSKKQPILKKSSYSSKILHNGEAQKKLNKKQIAPKIRVITSEDSHSVVEQGNIKINDSAMSLTSPNASSIRRLNESFDTSKASSSNNNKNMMISNQPMTWFNFERRNIKPSLKRLKSFRNTVDLGSSKTFMDNQTEFLNAFDQALNATMKTSQVNQPILHKISNEHDVSAKSAKSLPRQISKTSAPLEELLKHDFDEDHASKAGLYPDGRKTLSNDNETSEGKIQPLLSREKTIQTVVEGLALQEEQPKNILGMYSRKNEIIVINMFPPPISEESAAVEESPYPKQDENEDETTMSVELPKKVEEVLSQGFMQFTFDLVTRKAVEEESLLFDEVISREESTVWLDHRTKVEELFQYDEIFKSKMDNLNTKAQKLRIRSNFFSFVEKALTLPAEKYIQYEVTNDDRAPHSVMRSLEMLKLKVDKQFEYMFKMFAVKGGSFYSRFLFELRDSGSSSQIGKPELQNSDEFEYDDCDEEKSKVQSTNLVFASGEIASVKFILEDCRQSKQVVDFNPIMISIGLETLALVKKFRAGKVLRELVKSKEVARSFTNIHRVILDVIESTSDKNWAYIKYCLLKSYENTIHGFFEARVVIGKERILKSSDSNTMCNEIKVSKRRDIMVSGKEWRYGAASDNLRLDKKFKITALGVATAVELGNKQAEFKGENTPKKSFTSGVERVTSLGVSYQKNQRRVSKVYTSPMTPSTADPKSVTVGIEKSSTVLGIDASAEAKHRRPSMSKKSLSHKIVTQITAFSNTSEKHNKLAIPTKSQSIRNMPVTFPQRQETKLETVDEKVVKKNSNVSVSPSSEKSAVPTVTDFAGGTSNLAQERGKPKLSDAWNVSSVINRMLSSGTNKDREETAQQLLAVLQSRKQDNPEQRRSPIFYPRSPTQSSQTGVMKAKSTPYKKNPLDKGVEAYIFDIIYSNMFAEVIKLLKILSNIRDEEDNTPLILAAKAGYISIIELLLGNGCDPDSQNMGGDTALHVSLAYGNYDVADCLVKHGARQNIQNYRGKTAWDEY